jgi:hypothetical protein
VTSIGEYAFYDCISLANINIPNGVTHIGMHAFANCSSIENIEIPNSVNMIGMSAFSDCSSLLNVKIPNGITVIEDSTFSNCTSLASVLIPDSVVKIDNSAFNNCKAINCLTLPYSITSFEGIPFSRCGGEVIVNCNTVRNKPYDNVGVFEESSFTKVTIGDNVTNIGIKAFYNLNLLECITIGENVVLIDTDAIYSWKALTSIYCKAIIPPTMKSSIGSKALIYVPIESVDAYKSAEGWSQYADQIVGFDFENGIVAE